MPDIKDQIAQFEKKSIKSDVSKHGGKSVQQKAGAGARVQETQVQSHAEQGLRERRVQTSSGRTLPTPPTPIKTKRDPVTIQNLYSLARINLLGKNYQKAELLYTEAAEAGHIEAALFLAKEYSQRLPFGYHPEKVFSFAKIAADSGDPEGFEILAKSYKEGIGVERDYTKARDYYKQAVAAGRSVEQIIFDELECEGFTDYQKGERFEHLAEERLKAGSKDVESYLVKAKGFYTAAFDVPGAKEKAADMEFRNGDLYEKGIGGFEVDLEAALLFYQDAFKEGSPLAKAKFEDIERLLRKSYESEGDIQGELTQQPLVNYINEQYAYTNEEYPTLQDGLKFLYKAMGIPLIDQASLHVKFSRFLNQLAVLSPNSYSRAEIYRIGTEMKGGECNGFSLYYAILALSLNDGKVQDNTRKYAEFITEICNWDRPLFEPPEGFSYDKFRAGDKQGLTEDEIERLAFTDKFKTLIQMIRYGQQQFGELEEMNKGAKEGESLSLDQGNIQLLLGDEFVSRIQIFRDSVMVKQTLHDSISLMELNLTESNVGLLSYSTDPLSSHIVSITFRDGQYFYFDSNQYGFEKNYDHRYSAIACDTLDEVIDLIVKGYNIDETLQGQVSLKVIERSEEGAALPPLPLQETPRIIAARESLYQVANKLFNATNRQEAEAFYIFAAEAGHVKSALFLARAYITGVPFGENPENAFRFAQMAVDLDAPEGFEILAKCYKDGIGTVQNYAKARDYYTKAVAAGNTVEQIILDELECEGLTDYQKGERFEKLAEEKLKAKSKNIESYLDKARGFYEAALDISGAKEKAADMTFRIGELYEKGIGGVRVDSMISLEIYNDALKKGSPLAKAKFADIEGLLSESYAGVDIQSKLTQQPLVRYLTVKAPTFANSLFLLYGANLGFHFDSTGAWLKTPLKYWADKNTADDEIYKKMIVQLRLEKNKRPSQTEAVVKPLLADDIKIPPINHLALLDKFSVLLDQLAVLSPDRYSQTEIDRIRTNILVEGATQLSLYYAQYALYTDDRKVKDITDYYAELMTKIMNWDRPLFVPPQGFSYDKLEVGDKQGLTDDEIERLDFTDNLITTIQAISGGQQVFRRDAKVGEIRTLPQFTIQDKMGDAFDTRIYIEKESVELRNALHDMIPLMKVSLHESNLAVLSYSTNTYSTSVSITFREGKYFYFDARHKGDEENYDLRHSALAFDTVDEVVQSIVNRYGMFKGLEGNVRLQVIERNDVKG